MSIRFQKKCFGESSTMMGRVRYFGKDFFILYLVLAFLTNRSPRSEDERFQATREIKQVSTRVNI